MYSFAEFVYETLQGELCDPVPGVRNAFEDGSSCSEWYQDMLDAYRRICTRLGENEEDPDLEIIIFSLSKIQKELCFAMFQYGNQFRP